MREELTSGAVIFVGNPELVAAFYSELAGLARVHSEPGLVVLQSDSTQLVIHALRIPERDPAQSSRPPEAREDSYVKLYFSVPSLAGVRARAADLGGGLGPIATEWIGRGFRACDGVDPEGNVVQFRERYS